jgi:drug/metabolite transporter (DMT)-like permease
MALTLNLSIFGAFERVSIAVALIGFYTYPAMVAAVAIALGRDEPSPAVIASLALALAGMVAVVAGNLDPSGGLAADPVGILLALGAAASQTVFVTISRDGYARVPAEQATATILGSTLAGCAVIALVTGAGTSLLQPLGDPDLLPVVLAAGAAGAGIPSLLFLTAIRRVGGTRAGILMLLEPVIALGLAAWLLGESLHPAQLGGALAVLAAALLLQRSHRSAPAPARENPPVAAHETVPGPPPTR